MHRPANDPNDLETYFVARTNAGDLEGLVALYEPGAIIADGERVLARGLDQIRDFFVKFLANCPKLDASIQTKALCSGELALTSSQTSSGDLTAEIARRQPDGSWLWVIDQFTLGNKR